MCSARKRRGSLRGSQNQKRASHSHERRSRITGNLLRIPLRRREAYLKINRRFVRHFVPVEDGFYLYGHKNIDCPHYDDCLASACKTDSYWVCNGCSNEYAFEDKSKEIWKILCYIEDQGER